ncbi:LysR substrate-binding domain-containing protein [Antricoccus suffuscus]|uniref:LysR substrate-binding domain-containing protein n=1 Tax=Antricoccus suffuscus TaxID=1629062 RepID=UPI001EDE39D0|nr:LysR substrate-binding domain-containing protein [Antricoccus suffuscus]
MLVPRTVAALLNAHPALQVVIDEAATPVLLRRLRARRLDVALVALGTAPAESDVTSFRAHALPVVGLRIAVPADHRLARRRTVQPRELADEAWIAGVGSPGEPQFGAWPTVGEPRIAYTVRHWTTRLGLVAAGLGITVLPGTMASTVPADVRVLTVHDRSYAGGNSTILTRSDPGRATDLAVNALLEQASALRAQAND